LADTASAAQDAMSREGKWRYPDDDYGGAGVESYRQHSMAKSIQLNFRTGIFVSSRFNASIGNSP
jgi:hypothetical protein